MVRLSTVACMAFSTTILAIPAPAPIQFDPSGDKNIGNGQGLQFVGGACLSSADCASDNKCCAFVAGVLEQGICSSSDPNVATSNGKAGCGFGDSGSPPAAADTQPAAADSSSDTVDASSCGGVADMAGSQNAGKGNGQQFITGQCLSAADCASGCCVDQGNGMAVCKARLVTEQAGLSCDFSCSAGSAPSSNDDPIVITPLDDAETDTSTQSATVSSGSCGAVANTAGSQNVGKGNAQQFITGQCFSKADCASNCCVAQDSGVALCKASLLTQQQGLSCDFSCAAGAAPAAAAAEDPAPANNAASSGGGACGAVADTAGSQNVGKGTASQFITGQCFSKADCASGCCVAQANGIALCKASLLTQQQGLSCDFTCVA